MSGTARIRLIWTAIAALVLAAGLVAGEQGRGPAPATAVDGPVNGLVDGLEAPDSTFVPPARLPELQPGARMSADAVRRVAVFKRTVRAFAYDLARTGRVPVPEAKAMAEVAVTESYRVGIPPALVIGVMSVESDFTPRTVSSVGAIGYMQVMPEVWGPVVERAFGGDIRDPETNVRAGIAILAHYAARTSDWRTLLLRYNGCVRGTNTPNCFTYPDKVRRAVMRYAIYTCPGGDFERCVVTPLDEVFSESSAPSTSLARTVGVPVSVPPRTQAQ